MEKSKFLIIIVAVLLIFSLNIFQGQVRGLFYYFSSPVQKAFWAAGGNLSDFFKGVFKKSDLLEENKDLRLVNQELLTKLAESEDLEKENTVLREALEIGLADDFELVFATVIGRDTFQDSILIDKGLANGLKEDMSVIIADQKQKVLLGKIDSVDKNFAKVILISHKDSSFDVEVLGKEAEGLIKGGGGQKMNLDFLPRDKVIERGDVVISSALGGVYPKGLLVGLIAEAQRDDVKSFQQAEVSPFFRLREVRNVFVILK